MSPQLKLYNTLTRSKEVFRPLDERNVRTYVCGPTVYDYAHIGNARPFIVFDVLFRLLRHVYGPEHVRYVRNITDVDDKINARAAERGISIRALTEETNKVFQEDVKAIGCLEPSVQPRATEHIAEMIAIIEKLIASGHAYAADGHVLFDVPSMSDYGRLSRRSLDEMLAGARVDVAPYKRGDMDFVLWKPSKGSEPGWESPWGYGRPGWHLECSAMSWKHLGETFDIHGGGIDLVFPHHENEIAQSRCAFHTGVMANVWMHNGFLQVEGEKMSKSLGNFVTIHELLHTEKFGGRKWPGEVLRLAMLRTHYRQPIDFTVKALEEADEEQGQWAAILDDSDQLALAQTSYPEISAGQSPPKSLIAALEDDLNTPEALKVIRSFAAQAHQDREAWRSLLAATQFLGVCSLNILPAYRRGVEGENVDPQDLFASHADVDEFRISVANNNPAAAMAAVSRIQERPVRVDYDLKSGAIRLIGNSSRIDDLITARFAARAAKNWAESDRIRDELAGMGVALKDNKDGTTTWEVKR